MNKAERLEGLRLQARAQEAAGRLAEAERLYQNVLQLDSRDLEARQMIAVIWLRQGKAHEALALLAPLVEEAPGHADIRTHYGLALQELSRPAEALAAFERALAIAPGNAMTLLCRGNLLMEMGRPGEALADYDCLLAMAPGYDEAWFRRGNALWLLERHEEALASFAKALERNPAHFGAAFNSGTVLLKLERYDQAFAAFERARALAPDHPYVLGGAASAVLGACDLARWPDYQAQVTKAVAHSTAVIAPLTFLPFSDDGALRRVCAEIFVQDRVPAAAPLWTGRLPQRERIRIAYLSADFRQHATAELIAGLIERHDRSRFEVAAISFGRDDQSPMRARLIRAFDHFQDVRGLADADVARRLWEKEFDIAVDLKGHTEEARPGILAHRPCPVQVNYLGYPGTVASWLDYVIGDALVLPFSAQPFYSEKIVQLPHCYQANDSTRAIATHTPSRAEANLPEKAFVFCCFNAAWKIAPAMFEIWMRLLKALPDSVLWLLEDNPCASANLCQAAAMHGVDPRRLIFAPRMALAQHLARHRLADLFLDTLPYNAHTTASDALWVGLPLVTCLGSQFDGRVAASLLSTLGLSELVTENLQAYEMLALELARDPARLRNIHVKLAASRLSSPLYDADRFRRSIEAAYLRMAAIARQGLSPQSFTVTE